MANFNFNKAIIGGRLSADPELKSTSGGVSVTSFSVAVNRRFSGANNEQQTDFINVVAWRQTAEFVSRHFRKGSSICIVGSIQTRSWTDQNGQKRYATDVVADEVLFVDSKKDSEGNPTSHKENSSQSNFGASTYVPDAYRTPDFAAMSADESLPF